MFNLIAKAKEAGYQFWISASKVLTVTTGTEVGLNIVKTVTDINPCLLVAELMNLGITLSPDNNYFCWLDREGDLWAVDRHHLYRGNTGEHGISWEVIYQHGMVINTPEQASILFKIPHIGRFTATVMYSAGYTTDWVLPAYVDFSGQPDHETILSWLSEVGIRNAGMQLEDIEFLSVEEKPDAYISL